MANASLPALRFFNETRTLGRSLAWGFFWDAMNMEKQMNQQVQKLAVKRLAAQGWVSDRLLTHVLSKEYASAVGNKRASARVDRSGTGYWLSGEYWSEGGNILSCCSRTIPSSTDKEAVNSLVDAFLVDIEKRISESYAVRLLAFGVAEGGCARMPRSPGI